MFDLSFTRSSASDISVSASFDQMAISVNPSIAEFPDTYTGFNVNLGTDTVASGLSAYDNLYVGMGHTIANQNQVALSGSSYDGLSTQNFTVVPEPGSVLLTALTGGMLLGLRRRR